MQNSMWVVVWCRRNFGSSPNGWRCPHPPTQLGTPRGEVKAGTPKNSAFDLATLLGVSQVKKKPWEVTGRFLERCFQFTLFAPASAVRPAWGEAAVAQLVPQQAGQDVGQVLPALLVVCLGLVRVVVAAGRGPSYRQN